jgi:hypothetical protein
MQNSAILCSVLCFTAVHKFDFRLVIDENTSKNGDQCKESCVVRKVYVFDTIFMFSTVASNVRDSIHAVQVNCILLTKGQYYSP